METDSSWEVRAFAEDVCKSGMLQWPPSSYSCSFCHREFRTAQALGGHMNVHRRERAAHKNAQRDPSYALHQLAPVTPERKRGHQIQTHRPAPSSDPPPLVLTVSSQLVNYFSDGSVANLGSNTTASSCTDHCMSSFQLSQESIFSNSSSLSSSRPERHHHLNQPLIQQHLELPALESSQKNFEINLKTSSSSYFQKPDYCTSLHNVFDASQGSRLRDSAAAAANASCRSITLVQELHQRHHHHHHQLPIKSLDLELRLGHSS